MISWGTKDLIGEKDYSRVPSHVAILVKGRWVHESTLSTGVRVISYSEWLKLNEQLGRIEGQDMEYRDLKNKFKEIKDKKYDWFGVIYFGYRVILKMLFNSPLPKKNKWQSEDKYFCCEVLGDLIGIDYEMICPGQIMRELTN